MYRVSVYKLGIFFGSLDVSAGNALLACELVEAKIKKSENSFCYEFVAKLIS